jgi:hypothetical protein
MGVLSAVVALAALAAPTTPTEPAAPPAEAAGPAPKITFDKTEVNVGDVVRGQDVVATFTYRNTGTSDLHIRSAKPG